MIVVQERLDGTRRVSIDFNQDEKVLVRKSNDRAGYYEFYPSRSLAKSEFHKDSNINRIIKKYKRTGILGDPLQYRDLQYGDFSNGNDFAEMSMRVRDAEQEFNNLPAKVRNRFKNDPRALLDFINDPKNDKEAIELGLKVAPKVTKEVQGNEVVYFKDGVEFKRGPVVPDPATKKAEVAPAAAAGAGAGSST